MFGRLTLRRPRTCLPRRLKAPRGNRSRTGTSWPRVTAPVQPELQRFVAKRMGATTYEVDSSHVPRLSNPELVIDVIRDRRKRLTSRWLQFRMLPDR